MKPNTRYVHPIGPEFSKLHKDPEMLFLSKEQKPIIIGLTGPTKSGKTQIAKYLVTEFNFQYISMSLPIKTLARRLGLYKPNWLELNELAYKLRNQTSTDFLAQTAFQVVTSISDKDNKNRFVIDGILHPAEIIYLRNKFPLFSLIGVIADPVSRKEEAKKWGVMSSEQLDKRDEIECVEKSSDDPIKVDVNSCLSNCDWRLIIKSFSREEIFQQTEKIMDIMLAKK